MVYCLSWVSDAVFRGRDIGNDVSGIHEEVLSSACEEREMGEELRIYCLRLIDEVPPEAYEWALLISVVGVLLLIGLFGLKRGGRYFFILLLIEYVGLIYSSTVFFRHVLKKRAFEFTPFWSYNKPELIAENLMNVVIFIPVGALAGVALRRMTWKKVLMIGLCLSVGIEVLQFVFMKGFSEVDDVMHNTIGCLIGYGLYAFFSERTIRIAHFLFSKK